MAYELSVRSSSKGQESSQGREAAVGELLQCVGEGFEGRPSAASDPLASWKVSEGGTEAQLRPTKNDRGEWIGVDLMLPYGAPSLEVEALVHRLNKVAADQNLQVFDPQLSAELSEARVGELMERYKLDSEYHLNIAGLVEDPRQGIVDASAEDPHRRPPLGLQFKILGGLAILFLGSWLLFRGCVVNPMMRKLQGEEAASAAYGEPSAAWLATHPPVLRQADPPGNAPDAPSAPGPSKPGAGTTKP